MNIATPAAHPQIAPASLTREIVKFASELRVSEIDPVALHASRRHMMDTLGANHRRVSAGCHRHRGADPCVPFCGRAAEGEATLGVPGLPEALDLLTAAYISGLPRTGWSWTTAFVPE